MRLSRISTIYADYAGIIAAIICLIHCLAGPLILGVTAHNHGHEHTAEGPWYLHRSWDFVFLGAGLLAVWQSSRHSQQRWMKSLLWITFGFLAGAVLLEEQGPWFRYLVYLSSLGLIVAHLFHLRRHLSPSDKDKSDFYPSSVPQRAVNSPLRR